MVGRIYKSILVFTLAFSALLMAQTPPDNPLAPYIPKNMKPYYLDILVIKDSSMACKRPPLAGVAPVVKKEDTLAQAP